MSVYVFLLKLAWMVASSDDAVTVTLAAEALGLKAMPCPEVTDQALKLYSAPAVALMVTLTELPFPDGLTITLTT